MRTPVITSRLALLCLYAALLHLLISYGPEFRYTTSFGPVGNITETEANRLKLETLSSKQIRMLLSEHNQDCVGCFQREEIVERGAELLSTLRYEPFGWTRQLHLSEERSVAEETKENASPYGYIPLLSTHHQLVDYTAEKGFVVAHVVARQYNASMAAQLAKKLGQWGVSSAIFVCGSDKSAPLCRENDTVGTYLIVPPSILPRPYQRADELAYYTTTLSIVPTKPYSSREDEELQTNIMHWVAQNLPDYTHEVRALRNDMIFKQLKEPLALHVSKLPHQLPVFTPLSWRFHKESTTPFTLARYRLPAKLPSWMGRTAPAVNIDFEVPALYIMVPAPFAEHRTMQYRGPMDIDSLERLLHVFYPTSTTVFIALGSALAVIYIIDVAVRLEADKGMAFVFSLATTAQFGFILPIFYLVVAEVMFQGSRELPSLSLWQLLVCSNSVGVMVAAPFSFITQAGLLLIMLFKLVRTIVVASGNGVQQGRNRMGMGNRAQRAAEEMWEDQVDPYMMVDEFENPFAAGDWRGKVVEVFRDMPPHAFRWNTHEYLCRLLLRQYDENHHAPTDLPRQRTRKNSTPAEDWGCGSCRVRYGHYAGLLCNHYKPTYEQVGPDEIRGGGEECAVCMEPLSTGQVVCTLGCEHTYHAQCVFRWLIIYSGSCPTCRQPADIVTGGWDHDD